jgi:hypothetical protein
MNREAKTRRTGDVMIGSDWITTTSMAFLFAVVAFLLFWSIRDLLFDKLGHPVHLHLYYLITAAYSFLFAYSFPSKALKVAFLLLGTDVTVRVALGYLSASTGLQHSAAVAGSVARQIAYTIILFEIARWFRSVIRRPAPPDSGLSDS